MGLQVSCPDVRLSAEPLSETRTTLSVRIAEKAELSWHCCLCARSSRAVSQQGPVALSGVLLADLTGGSGMWVPEGVREETVV